MPRNISIALTTEQIRNRTKTVTRRKGWWTDKHNRLILPVGTVLMGCEKVQGIQRGGLVRLGLIRITAIHRENLNAMILDVDYGRSEAAKEGFPEMSGVEFVAMFCEHMGGEPSQLVTRIEFEYVEDSA